MNALRDEIMRVCADEVLAIPARQGVVKELAAYLSADAPDDIIARIGADLDQRERERSAAAEALMASIAAKAESAPAFHGAPLRRGFRDRTARYMARVHGARTPDEAH